MFSSIAIACKSLENPKKIPVKRQRVLKVGRKLTVQVCGRKDLCGSKINESVGTFNTYINSHILYIYLGVFIIQIIQTIQLSSLSNHPRFPPWYRSTADPISRSSFEHNCNEIWICILPPLLTYSDTIRMCLICVGLVTFANIYMCSILCNTFRFCFIHC